MGRRRQDSRWIHRWSRPLVAGIASVGALGTAYLTVVKWLGGSACPTEGCDSVLSSDYATIFGLPLTLFGFLAYITMVILAASPLLVNGDKSKELRQTLENRTWPLMFILSCIMVVFSGYLMSVLAFELKELCPYCVTSATFALSMFLIILFGKRWEDFGQIAFTGIIVAVITLTGTLAVYAPIRNGGVQASTASGETGPPINTTSGPAEIALANHLKEAGATMYGAWWCPHCYDQKSYFGAEAAQLIPYVECAQDGKNAQPKLCRSEPQVTGFPTWQINGEFYPGAQSLERLAELSGYTGPMDFQS